MRISYCSIIFVYHVQISLITHNNYNNLPMLSFQNREDHQKKESLHQMAIQKAAHLKCLNSQKFKKIQFRENKSLNLSHQQYNSLPRGVPDLPEISRRQSDTIEVDKDHEIYFNRNKKYNYMKKIIDKYFEQTKGDKFYSRSKYNSQQLDKTNIYRTIGSIDSSKNNNKTIIDERRVNPRKLIELGRKNKQKVDNDQDEDLNSTLSHSRLIQNNQQQREIGRNLSFSTKSNYSLLPIIDEMYQDKDQNVNLMRYQSISRINDSQVEQVKETKLKLLENQIYRIELVLKNNIPSHKIKTYKQKGQALLSRELKAHSMDVESTWVQYKYDPKCLITNTNPCLKQLLFKAKKLDAQAKFLTLKQKKYYSKLIYNNCQQLKRVIRQFCIFMRKNQSRIVNNKINTGNIFINKNQNFRLGEWGFSSFRETHIIQNMEFENRIEPIIKSQKEWFIPPEYMAPEIIKAIALDQETDPMNLGSAPDRWSLGVMIFEILTLIPVWIPQKCMIHGKTMIARSGILAVPQRDLKKLLKREQKLPYTMRRVIQQQFGQSPFDESLVYVMLNCVQFQPEQRKLK